MSYVMDISLKALYHLLILQGPYILLNEYCLLIKIWDSFYYPKVEVFFMD